MRHYDVVLDTNIVFSALYSNKGASFKLLSLIGKELFTIHLSVPLILEYEEKLKEKRKLLGLSLDDIDDFIDYVCLIGKKHYEINIFWRPCLSDPDDEMVLELGVHSQADFIITHNIKDFQKVKGFRIKAISPGEFLKILREEKYI